jgi:hypothetical protein
MANRSMQAKSLKLKRQRRLFPRSLSADYVPTGKPPNTQVIQEYKERTRSLAFDDEYIDYLVKRASMEKAWPHPGRAEIEAHLQRIKEAAPGLMCVSLLDSKITKVRMFFNESRNRFVLFEDNKLQNFIRTSLVYMDRQRCIRAFQSESVRWVSFSSLRPPCHSD